MTKPEVSGILWLFPVVSLQAWAHQRDRAPVSLTTTPGETGSTQRQQEQEVN